MEEQKKELGFLQILILCLSVYILIALFIDTIYTLPQETSELLQIIDTGICIVFIIDFCIRFYKAESKLSFLKWGWIDLISSIPNLDVFRAGRLVRVIRILRILRAIRSTKLLVSYVFATRKQGAFTSVAIISIVLVIFSSIAILNVETEPDCNIKTAEDALWWSFVTITTVGYGDKYPITTEGRLIAGVLMFAGVGLFGTFTGYVASWFMEDPSRNKEKPSS